MWLQELMDNVPGMTWRRSSCPDQGISYDSRRVVPETCLWPEGKVSEKDQSRQGNQIRE